MRSTASCAAAAATHSQHVGREIAAQWRAAQHFLFGRVQACDAKQGQIGLPHQRRLSPETHQLGSSASGKMRYHHAIEAAGRRRSGCIQIGVAVHVKQAYVAEIAARACHYRQRDGAIASQNHRQRSHLDGLFYAGLERLQRGNHTGKVSGSRAFRIGLGNLYRIVAEVGNLITDGLKPSRKARGAESGRCGFVARRQGRRTGGCA